MIDPNIFKVVKFPAEMEECQTKKTAIQKEMESDDRRHLDVSPTAKELEDLLAVDQSVMMIYPTAVDEVNCSGSLQAEKSLQGTQPSQDLVELRGVPLQVDSRTSSTGTRPVTPEGASNPVGRLAGHQLHLNQEASQENNLVGETCPSVTDDATENNDHFQQNCRQQCAQLQATIDKMCELKDQEIQQLRQLCEQKDQDVETLSAESRQQCANLKVLQAENQELRRSLKEQKQLKNWLQEECYQLLLLLAKQANDVPTKESSAAVEENNVSDGSEEVEPEAPMQYQSFGLMPETDSEETSDDESERHVENVISL